MHSLNDLLALRQHMRSALASLRAQIAHAAHQGVDHLEDVRTCLDESAYMVSLFDCREKNPVLEAQWARFRDSYDHYQDALTQAAALVARWRADSTPDRLDVAARFIVERLSVASSQATGLLNHMITSAILYWPEDGLNQAGPLRQKTGRKSRAALPAWDTICPGHHWNDASCSSKYAG